MFILIQGKLRNRKHNVVDAHFLQLEFDRILFEKKIEKRQLTDRAGVGQEIANKLDDIVEVLVVIHETDALAPGQFSDDIKSEELEPLGEVARPACITVACPCLLNEGVKRAIHERFVSY